MGNDSFDKPSDFSGDEGDGGGRNIWLWLGGGCAILFVIGALLLVFGAYKGFSCCQQALERQARARAFTVKYARHLRDGNYGAAWKRSSEAFRSRTDRESFRRRIVQYTNLIEGSVPEVRGINRHIGRDEADYWQVEIGFMPRGGQAFLTMTARIVQEGTGEKAKFRVASLQFRKLRRNLAAEPAVRRVQAFNRHISEDRLDRARAQLAGGFEQAASAEAFEAFVQEHGNLLGRTIVRVRAVRYRPGAKVAVDALQDRRGGSQVGVRYHLAKSGGLWRIVRIEFAPGDDTDSASNEGAEAGGDTGIAPPDGDAPNLDAN